MSTQTTQGQRIGKINYFTKLNSIEEHIGDRVIFHGLCTTSEPVMSTCDMMPIHTIGRKEVTYSGRFQMIDGTLWYASPRKKKFHQICRHDQEQWCTYLTSMLVSKVGA